MARSYTQSGGPLPPHFLARADPLLHPEDPPEIAVLNWREGTAWPGRNLRPTQQRRVVGSPTHNTLPPNTPPPLPPLQPKRFCQLQLQLASGRQWLGIGWAPGGGGGGSPPFQCIPVLNPQPPSWL